MLARGPLNSGIIGHSLCKNITLYLNESVFSASRTQNPHPTDVKPLVLMLPWLGSRHQALAKYCEIYFRSGFDVLVVESNVKDFLWPRWGLEYGERILELLQSDRFVSRPLLVHAFSIGGFTFGQMLVHVSRDPQKYQGFTSRIKGHVYDSLLIGSIEEMAAALGKTVFPRFESLAKHASLLYFSVFKHQTVDNINMTVDVFRNNPITAPALFFFCENDSLCEPRALENVIDFWQKRGMDVTAKSWADSTHAGHLRRHPQDYQTTLDCYLHSLRLVRLTSKM